MKTTSLPSHSGGRADWQPPSAGSRDGVPSWEPRHEGCDGLVSTQSDCRPQSLDRMHDLSRKVSARGANDANAGDDGGGSQVMTLIRKHSAKDGASIDDLFAALTALKDSLSELETKLLATLDRTTVATATSALGSVRHPAVAIDRFGRVLDANDDALRLFDRNLNIRNRRLMTNDREASASLKRLVDNLSDPSAYKELAAQPIVVRREQKSAIVIRVFPLRPVTQARLTEARILLTFSVLEARVASDRALLMRLFSLTPAEARLAALVAEGLSPEGAAKKLGIKRETCRNQLKAIFAKTETNRQGQLVAMLASLSS